MTVVGHDDGHGRHITTKAHTDPQDRGTIKTIMSIGGHMVGKTTLYDSQYTEPKWPGKRLDYSEHVTVRGYFQ